MANPAPDLFHDPIDESSSHFRKLVAKNVKPVQCDVAAFVDFCRTHWGAVAETIPAPLPVAPPPAVDDRDRQIAQLKELADLKAQGVLTDEEFAAQKAQILGG